MRSPRVFTFCAVTMRRAADSNASFGSMTIAAKATGGRGDFLAANACRLAADAAPGQALE
jgi:hypothetical protein